MRAACGVQVRRKAALTAEVSSRPWPSPRRQQAKSRSYGRAELAWQQQGKRQEARRC
jgi:hypothetical protein